MDHMSMESKANTALPPPFRRRSVHPFAVPDASLLQLQALAGNESVAWMIDRLGRKRSSVQRCDPRHLSCDGLTDQAADHIEPKVAARQPDDSAESSPNAAPKVWYMLNVPPSVCESGCECWAGAAASFLKVTGINPSASRESLVLRFGGCTDDSGCLLEENLLSVYGELGVALTRASGLDYTSALRLLKEKGHFVALLDYGGDMGHAVVVYGVGVAPSGQPSRDHFSAFDPMTCQYTNFAFSDVNVAYIGTRSRPGTKAACSASVR
ncbi:MAG: hypothetical protein QOI86_4290 [Actinomycetota bacterium]|jgi:hypothetical protein|nr:hypothetical protein [Actinomycetota bacterium]